MRVGVNLSWLVPGDVGGSEQAVTRALRAVLDHGSTDVEPVLFVLDAFVAEHRDLVEACETHVMPASGPLSSPGRGAVIRAGSKPVRILGEHTWLPWAVNKAGVDIVHDAGGTVSGAIEVPRVLGLHDIQPLDIPRNFNPVKVAWLRRAIPAAVRKAALVIVPSEFVRGRMIEVFGLSEDTVRVVPWSSPPPAPVDRSFVDRFRVRHDATGPLIVQASITYPHKEHATTIAAFRRIAARHPDARLVLAGGPGPAERAVQHAIEVSGVARSIIRTGRLRNDEIAALVAEASAVVVPSSYEGFGIPALEAMAAGTPVVVSDAASLPEVVGRAGAIFPVRDDAQLAIAMHHAIEPGESRDRAIEEGRRRAASFSPERTATALVESWRAAYRNVSARR